MRLSGYFASYRVADFFMYAEIRLRQFSKLPQLFFYLFASRELLSIHSFLRGCGAGIAAAAIPLFCAYHTERVLYIQQRRFKKPTEKNKEGDNR